MGLQNVHVSVLAKQHFTSVVYTIYPRNKFLSKCNDECGVPVNLKTPDMKLSTALLTAIVAGITLQAATSCTKTKEDPATQTSQQEKEKKKVPTDPCPACGMG